MGQWKDYGIIKNHDTFTETHIPAHIPGRDTQIKELQFCLSPAIKKSKPFHAWLFGKPGSGKTVTSRHILNQLHSAFGVRGAYVNCWEHTTLYSVLDKLVADLRILGADKPDASFKLQRFERRIKDEPMVIVLDEIDQPTPKERNAIPYNLCNLQKVGLVCICNSRSFLFSLDERIKSRLNPTQIEFRPYSADEIAFILKKKAGHALIPEAWNRKTISKIAELAAGDARLAIKTLKNSAVYAEKAGDEKIKHG